jgi:AcrR family transcriptional regulator
MCGAAEGLFLRDGYARTSIRAVAKAAGVSEAAVYVAFDNKAALLGEVIDRATRDNPSESLEAIAAAPPAEVLMRLASSNAVLMARAARLIALGDSAAFMYAEFRPLRERAHENLRAGFRRIADRLDDAGLLGVSAADAADTIYGIVSDSTYLRMTEGVGLTSEQYAQWLNDTLAAVVLSSSRA